MNFGSEFALHDSDDEGEEEVREDAPAGPLSSLSSGPALPLPGAGAGATMYNAITRAPPPVVLQRQQQQQQGGPSLPLPPPPGAPPQAMFYPAYNDAAQQHQAHQQAQQQAQQAQQVQQVQPPPRGGEAEKSVRWTETTQQSPLPHGEHWPMLKEKLSLAWNRRTPARGGGGGGGGRGGGGGGGLDDPALDREAKRAVAAAEDLRTLRVETPSHPRDPNPTQIPREVLDAAYYRVPTLIGGVPRGGVPWPAAGSISGNFTGGTKNAHPTPLEAAVPARPGRVAGPQPPAPTLQRDPDPTRTHGGGGGGEPYGKGGYADPREMLGGLGIQEGGAGAGGAGGGIDEDDDEAVQLPQRGMVGTGAGNGTGAGMKNKKKGGLGGGGAGGERSPMPPPLLPQGLQAPPLSRVPPQPQTAAGAVEARIAAERARLQQAGRRRHAGEGEHMRQGPQRRVPEQNREHRERQHNRVFLPDPEQYARRGFAELMRGGGDADGFVRGWAPTLPAGQQAPRPAADANAAATATAAAATATATATAAAAGAGGRRAAGVVPPRSRTWTRKVDTNILNVDMAALGNAAPYATGDPTICSGCRACLSAVSVLAPVPNKPTITTTAATAATATASGSQSAAAAGTKGASFKLTPPPRRPAQAVAAGGGCAAAGAGAEGAKVDAGAAAGAAANVGANGGASAGASAGANAGASDGANAGANGDANGDAKEEGGAFVEGAYDWSCEYCGEVNRLELDDMEKPVEGQDSVDYILEMAPVANAVALGKGGGDDKDESAVLFVIDTSGSMCVTTAVEGRLTLRGDRTKDMSRLLASGDDRNQLMPGQKQGMTYVSRLQSMQAAIDAQLQAMAKDTPSRHAGLVTFNAEVSLIGDGSADSRVVAGDRLSDGEALREVGRAYPLSRPVSEAKERLADRLFALEEGGPTALGPAVVAGLSMLKERGGRGSRLVLCTDGLANVGLGALDDLKGDEEREAAEQFYAQLGTESVENGVTVDVVSVDSDACDLENLGTMADKSGGTITRVKASELASNFAGILANPILASKVSVRVTLHKGLKFRNADVASDANTLDRDIGNVTRETELNFEYQVRSKSERQAMGVKDPTVASSPAAQPALAATTAASVPAPPAAATATAAAAAPPAPPSTGNTNSASVKFTTPAKTPAAAAAAAEVNSGKGPVAGGQGGSVPAPAEKGKDGGKAATVAVEAGATATTTTTTPAFLPFQVQICYTRPDGMKCMRVLTRTQKVTRSKKVAERSMSMAVVAGHAASQAGTMASRGAYQSTRVSMRAWSNLMSRNSGTEKAQEQVKRFGSEMAALDNELLEAQSSEGARPQVDQDEGGAVNAEKESATLGRNRKSARSGNDSLSFQTYKARTHSSKGYH